jgi:aminopeptidase-like protein
MHALMTRLFPLCRSITGDGTRQTLRLLKEVVPLRMKEVPSGTKAFDWTVPKEWNVRDAYVRDSSGRRVIDFKKSNLHLLNYSVPFRGRLTLEQLKPHLYTLPEFPNRIPYVASYYKERWGFCLTHKDFKKLKKRKYEVVVDTTLKRGSLTYADLLIPGKSKREILITTYVCHPSMANNELSGPVVSAFLARHILNSGKPELSYRFVFAPETIGSLVYLSRHLKELRKNVLAGYVVSCVGAPAGGFAYIQTRNGGTLADRAMIRAIKASGQRLALHDYLRRCSDERQYCAPGIDLPVGCLMRGLVPDAWDEYHTSADDLKFVTPRALEGALNLLKSCTKALEQSRVYRAVVLGEPQLGPRGLYPALTTSKGLDRAVEDIMNVLSFSDGTRDILGIAERVDRPVGALIPVAQRLVKECLLKEVK